MKDTISAGSILVEAATYLPRSVVLQSNSATPGWTALEGARSAFEQKIQAEGWTFFFMAGEISTTVFGFDRRKALQTALKRLVGNVKLQHCNTIEITQVLRKSFLSVPYVSVSAHPRHLQKGVVFSG